MSYDEKVVKIDCVLCRKPKIWRSPYQKFRNDINESTKVCNDCFDFWELGKKTAKATQADGKDTKTSVPIKVPISVRMGNPEGPTEVLGKDVMAAMGGVGLRGTELGGKWHGHPTHINLVNHQDKEDSFYIGGGSLEFKVPVARSNAMKKIMVAFFNAIAKARVDGFNEGRNLLTALANGDVSLETYSERADNARVGRKPKTRFGE